MLLFTTTPANIRTVPHIPNISAETSAFCSIPEAAKNARNIPNKTATADDPRYTWTFASNEGLQIFPTFELCDENDIYGLYSDSITFQCQGRLLNQAIYKFDSGNSYGSLASQSINTLNTLLGPLGTNPSVSITCKDGNTRSWNLNTHWGYNQEE